MKLTVNVKSSLIKKLRREAKLNGKTISAQAELIIETWLSENIFESQRIGKELGERLGEGIAAALDDAVKELATSDKTEWTVRVSTKGKPRGGRAQSR